MILPKKFKIANQEYTVKLVDHLDDKEFGNFDCVKAEIRIARKVESGFDDKLYDLSDEQILNSFCFLLFHCFNWHMNTECDETLAQSFANFMREYESTKED